MKSLRSHPLMFATFPILILLANNIDEVAVMVFLRALFLSLLGAVVLLVTIKLIVRQWLLASVITSRLLFLFYSYGHVYMWSRGLGAIGEAIGRHRIMVPPRIILFIIRNP